MTITRINAIPDYQWQKTAAFPDWKGYVDDTLAMNSMLSFHTWHGQGSIYLRVNERVERFILFVNGLRVDTRGVRPGAYVVDISDAALNGTNTLQVSNILPADLKGAVEVFVPYPVVLDGSPEAEGIRPATLDLIGDLIETDAEYGFPSAQLAIVRNGRLVCRSAWGRACAYTPDGRFDEAAPRVTNDTLYDLASVTKMFSANYALQKLATEGRLNPDARVVDLLGECFVSETIAIDFEGCEPVDMDTMRAWKASLTVRDLLCHQGGFPADPQYPNLFFDAAGRKYDPSARNALYSGCDGTDATREATFHAICKTPLMYRPSTKTVYSDVDYMLLGLIAEKITGQRLDEYLKETFFGPMGLERVTYTPLRHGFAPEDCAATELNGNSRDGFLAWPGVRTHTVRGEVHDEKAHYAMGGVSGHAGLFACATDLAKLACAMLTGGYGPHRFFSRNVMDAFTAPKSFDAGNWGLGWYREGDDQRAWYFGTQASSGVIGHQGWTGTLAMIDPARQLIVIYLTNKINSPVVDGRVNPNHFAGSCYTASTLGFVAQLISLGLDGAPDPSAQLPILLADMAAESFKLLPETFDPAHPAARNVRSKLDLLRRRAKACGDEEAIALSEALEKRWDALCASC